MRNNYKHKKDRHSDKTQNEIEESYRIRKNKEEILLKKISKSKYNK